MTEQAAMTEALLLEPVDVWSFRDGRPFEAGESFEARSVFPPYPWTVLGCLRTALLRRFCPDPERYAGRAGSGPCIRCGSGPCAADPVVGRAGEEAPFAIWPPLVAWLPGGDGTVQVFYAAPRDLARENGRGRLLGPVQLPEGVVHSLSLSGLAPVGALSQARLERWEREERQEGGWVSHAGLTAYLGGEAPQGSEGPPTVEREPRIGVGIEARTRSARRGQLYVRDVIRLEERAALLVRTDCPLDLDGEVGRLGGDGRMVAFRRVAAPSDPPVAAPLGPRLRVYLASPAWFAGGWRPSWIDEHTLEGRPSGCEATLRLVGVATGEPVAVGGWDLKHQRPRPLRHLVPAGSVYFFEVVRGDAEEVARAIHARPLCDEPAREDLSSQELSMARAGFGLAFVGRY